MNVRFFGGHKEDYLGIARHNPIGLYFCADTRELFWGDWLLSDGIRVVPTFADLPSISKHQAAEGVIYFVEETKNGYVFVSGRSDWLQVIYAPAEPTIPEVDLSGYYTKVEVDEAILSAITNIKLPEIDLTGYATETYVDEKVAAINIPEVPTKISELENDAGFITEQQDISHLATKEEVNVVQQQSARNEVKILAIDSELFDIKEQIANIPTTDLTGYATVEAVAAVEAKIPSVEGLATKQELEEAISAIEHPTVDLTGYATEQFVNEALTKIEIPDVANFVTVDEIEAKGYITEIPSEYITETELAAKGFITDVSGKAEVDHKHSISDIEDYSAPDLSEYAKRSELPDVSEFIKEIPAEYITETELDAKGFITTHQDLSEYAKKSDIPTDYLTTIPEEYITESELANELAKIEHPTVDLTGYATETWVNQQGFLTEHQDLSEYAKLTDIPTDYLKEIPAEYVTETELDAKGFLTEHQDLSEYAKKEDLFSGSYNDLADKPEIPSIEGLATEEYVNTVVSGIEIPETEIYKVDFNAPDYAKAVEAYNNGKVLVLVNAAPDINSYAVMNYVSEKYITFTKFLTSRSEAYGSFNTYYLSPANIWEISKEVRLNKVEANAEGEVNGELTSIRIGKEIYSLPNTAGLASEEFVTEAISALEIPEVPTNVSEFINDAGYLTQHQDISHLATKEEIPDVSGFITEIPEEYVTEAELTAKGYLTEYQDLSKYALKTDIPTDYLKAVPTEYITETELAEELAKIEHPSVDLTGYATEQFVSEAIAEIKIPDVSDFVTMSEVEAKRYITGVPAEYVTETELTAKGFITDISGKADVAHRHTLSDIEDYSAPDLSDYAKKTDIPDVTGFIKEVPAEYITETELNARGYISDISSKADINHDHDDLYDAKGAAQAVRDELLNGAGEAYDTLKELGSLIDSNKEALEALETIATGKADKEHTHSEYLTEQALNDYAKKTEIPDVTGFIKEIPAEYITETELTNKGYLTEHQSLDAYAKKDELFSKSYNDLTDKPEIPSIEGLATEEFVRTEIAQIDIPTVDTANLVTTETLANALVVKANEVPFTSAKFITKPFGNFEYGENIKDLSVAEIFAKLLGLEDTDPNAQGLVATIIHNQTPMYQITDNDEMVEIPWTGVIQYSSAEAATIKDGQTGFYKVVNESGETIEAGYQHYSTAKNPWYIVALPEVLVVAENGNVLLQTWSPSENKWDKAVYVLTADYEEIVSAYDAEGIEPPVAPEGYRLWADLSESDPGTLYRFIIKE